MKSAVPRSPRHGGSGTRRRETERIVRKPYRFNFSVLILLGTSFIASAVSSGGLVPSAPQEREVNFTLEGKITERAEGKLAVSADGNILFRVLYNQQTEIKQSDGGPASAKDLRVGAVIYVEGDLSESGEITALKIELRAKRNPERR